MPRATPAECKPDHRMMPVPMTKKMRAIAEQIAALQAEYRKLEAAEQQRALRAYLKDVRQRAVDRYSSWLNSGLPRDSNFDWSAMQDLPLPPSSPPTDA